MLKYPFFGFFITVLTAGSLVSCNHDGHTHDEHGNHEEHEEERENFTVWSDKTELFVDYELLFAQDTAQLAVHVTDLATFAPVEEGALRVKLMQGATLIDEDEVTLASPGLFLPSLSSAKPGTMKLVFEINCSELNDTLEFTAFVILPSSDDEQQHHDHNDDGGLINMGKEQAWKIGLQTNVAQKDTIYESIPSSGVWQMAPNDFQSLVAPNSGIVSFSIGQLMDGSPVSRNQRLLTISGSGLTSNNLSAEIKKAQADFDQADAEYRRANELYSAGVISKAEFELVEQKYQVTKTSFETLSKGYSKGGKDVLAPFGGFIRSIAVDNGTYVEEGAPLMVVAKDLKGLLEIQVSPSMAGRLNALHDVWYQPKPGVWSSLIDTGGEVLSIGKEVTMDEPSIAVFVQVNDLVEMPNGSFTEVYLGLGEPKESLVVPESALLEEYGKFSLMVQVGGESYERRQVDTGRRNGGMVEIIDGLIPGERGVTSGAYQVKMASMAASMPAHGHIH